MGTHVNPWLIHVNVWQKPLQYCKVISLQLIKINEGKKETKRHLIQRRIQTKPVASENVWWVGVDRSGVFLIQKGDWVSVFMVFGLFLIIQLEVCPHISLSLYPTCFLYSSLQLLPELTVSYLFVSQLILYSELCEIRSHVYFVLGSCSSNMRQNMFKILSESGLYCFVVWSKLYMQSFNMAFFSFFKASSYL